MVFLLILFLFTTLVIRCSPTWGRSVPPLGETFNFIVFLLARDFFCTLSSTCLSRRHTHISHTQTFSNLNVFFVTIFFLNVFFLYFNSNSSAINCHSVLYTLFTSPVTYPFRRWLSRYRRFHYQMSKVVGL